jgi:hypothetical protein
VDFINKETKNPIKIDGWNHHMEDKRQKARPKKGQHRRNLQEPKKGES